MFRFKADFKLTKLIVHLFLFVCIILSPAVLKAQPTAESSYEKEFFEKFYPIASNLSEDTYKKLESITAGLKSLPVSNETNAKIIQRLLIEADQTAEPNLLKAGIFWRAAELVAAQSNDRSVLANAIYYRANTLAALDKYREALIEYQRAVELFKDNPATTDQEKSVVCQIYLAAGETAANIDENATARKFFEKGWEILVSVKDWRKSKFFVPVARDLLLGWGNEGRLSGDYPLATAKFSEALALPGDDNFRRAEMLWELGKLKRDTGDFAAGATDFNEAIKLMDKTPRWNENERLNLQGNLYNSLGLLMLEQRFTKGAEQNLDQALALARLLKDSRLEGTVLRNLSIAARQRRDHQTARTRALAALEIAARTDLNDLNISANNILASLAQNSNDHQEAVERLQKSGTLAEQSRNVLRVVESKWRLGESLFALGKYKEAKKLVQESLSVAKKNQWSNLIYLSATLLGRVLAHEQNFSAAKEMFELAIREIEQKRQQVAGADVEKISFMGDKAIAYHELLKLRVKAGDTEQALLITEKLKSRVLEDKASGRKKIDLKFNLLSLKVPADTAVVSYTVTDEECLAFVFRPHRIQPKIFIIPKDDKILIEKIRRFRAGLLKFDPAFKSQAGELYTLLLKNLEGEIGDAKNLIIIPDGALWELPFQTLITSEKKYLIERYGISYAPSLGFLMHLEPPLSPGKKSQFLAFANSMPSRAPLLETEKEVDAVGKHYGKTSVFKSLAATETRFKALAPNAAQIHLAVHGEINSFNPFDSALLLTPTTKEDGRLTVSEILEMNLSANLVVLSSCDTSNGQVISGEGLLSLSWAFLASGVNDVVAAQWAVEEKATANLMVDFYRILNKNSKSPAAALRQAQIESLKLPAPFNHPFYWSGFVVIGKSNQI